MPVGRTSRRAFIAVLGGVAVWPWAARGQQSAIPVVGLLTVATLPDWATNGIRTGLGEAGFGEGRNLTIVSRSADGQFQPVARASIRFS